MEELLLNGKRFVLNQCDDLWKWFENSKVGEFTRYYSYTIFHKENGFYAAYSNDLSNGFYV